MVKEAPKWHAGGLILLCSRCHARSQNDKTAAAVAAENQRKALKSEMKDRGLLPHIRPVATSCLGVCPKHQMAVSCVQTTQGVCDTTTVPLDANSTDILQALPSVGWRWD